MARKSGAGGIIVLALVFGVVTAVSLWAYLKKEGEKQTRQPVVVAINDIPARTKITREMVSVEMYPKDLMAPDVFTKADDVINRVTKDKIKGKNQIRETDLLGEGQSATMAIKVHEGYRAVTIAANEVNSVGNMVQPGDRVDILATYQDPRTRLEVTRMILQNVPVLFVDRGRTDAEGKQGATSSMTLEVTPEQTELVKAAERRGTLAVTLRGVQDLNVIPTEGVTAQDLGIGQAPPEPTTTVEKTPVFIVPPSPNPRTKSGVTIIRGTEEKNVAQ
jgi:pilus assembly protein CpaB